MMVSTRRTTVVHPLLSVQGEWQPITQAAPVDSTMTSLEEVVEQTCPTIASVSVSIIGIIISFPLTGLHSQKLGYYFHLDFPRITMNLAKCPKWQKKRRSKKVWRFSRKVTWRNVLVISFRIAIIKLKFMVDFYVIQWIVSRYFVFQ